MKLYLGIDGIFTHSSIVSLQHYEIVDLANGNMTGSSI